MSGVDPLMTCIINTSLTPITNAQIQTQMEGVELELDASGFTKAKRPLNSQKSLISRISTMTLNTEM